MKFLKILTVLMCLASVTNAQMGTSTKRIADVYFLNKEYYAAAEYYKRMLQISPDSAGFVVPFGFDQKIKELTSKKNDPNRKNGGDAWCHSPDTAQLG